MLIVGTICALALVAMMLLSNLAFLNLIPTPNDLFTVVNPSYHLVFNLTIVFMTINEFLIGKIIGVWWEALFNWFVITLLLGMLFYYLPFQVIFSSPTQYLEKGK